MSELPANEIAFIINSYRAIEAMCKEWGVSMAEIENELPCVALGLRSGDLRATIKRILNERNLKQAAVATDMSTADYLALSQSLTVEVSGVTSLREDRPLTAEEWAKRRRPRVQPGLFDEQEALAPVPERISSEYYPLG